MLTPADATGSVVRAPDPEPAPPVNALAIVAFVLAFVVPPGAIACGHLALGQIRRTGEQGHGLALAGTILGWVLTAAVLLFVLLWFAVLASVLLGWLAVLPALLQRG